MTDLLLKGKAMKICLRTNYKLKYICERMPGLSMSVDEAADLGGQNGGIVWGK